jgi:hypothetical protein
VLAASLSSGGNATQAAGYTAAGSSLYSYYNSGYNYSPIQSANINSNAINGVSVGLSGTWRSLMQFRNGGASPKTGVYAASISLWVRVS